MDRKIAPSHCVSHLPFIRSLPTFFLLPQITHFSSLSNLLQYLETHQTHSPRIHKHHEWYAIPYINSLISSILTPSYRYRYNNHLPTTPHRRPPLPWLPSPRCLRPPRHNKCPLPNRIHSPQSPLPHPRPRHHRIPNTPLHNRPIHPAYTHLRNRPPTRRPPDPRRPRLPRLRHPHPGSNRLHQDHLSNLAVPDNRVYRGGTRRASGGVRWPPRDDEQDGVSGDGSAKGGGGVGSAGTMGG